MDKRNKKIIISVFFTSFIFGQSVQELQKAKDKYENIQSGNQQIIVPGQTQSTGMALPSQAIITPYVPLVIDDDSEDKLQHFGYEFFTKRDSVSFWENLPTPANYLLGSGDELVISIWGATQIQQTFVIARDGKIYDEKVGLLNLTGKNMEEAKSYLRDRFGRVYSTLRGQNPSAFIDVSLGALRSINVNFVGQMQYPGVYPVHPFSTVITGLIQAGGVDTVGSLRNIQIRRDGKLHSNVDLYDYFLKGNIPEKIQLRDQDIVIVPVKNSVVTIDSAVVNPGIFEGVPGESIYDLIQYAGGLKAESSSSIGLQRIKPINNRKGNDAYENLYINLEEAKLIEIQNGDQITVQSLFQQQEFVQIMGQVKVPGLYNFYDGMKFTDLLKLSGGLEDSTFRKTIYLDQAEIIRRNPDSRYEKIININLKNIYNLDIDNSPYLQNLDRIVIHANLNYFERKNIQILGEVNIPGSYPLLNDNESLQSLINRSGGLSSKALDNGISIYREKIYFEDPPKDKVLSQLQEQTSIGQTQIEEQEENKIKLAWEGLTVTLMPGDSIVVKEKVGAVFVTGEVYNSGLVEFQQGKSIRYYLNSAGGINNYGDRDNVIVVYPNGITVPWRRFRSPKILDGSTIVVYQKADLVPFNLTMFASTTASLVSSLVTIMVLSQQIQQN